MDTNDALAAEPDNVTVQLADGPVSAPATPPAPAPDAAEATEEEQARHGEGQVGVLFERTGHVIVGGASNTDWDEAVDVNDDDSDGSVDTPTDAVREGASTRRGRAVRPHPRLAPEAVAPTGGAGLTGADAMDTNDALAPDSGDVAVQLADRPVEGEYSAKDYAHLNVSAEVKDLFQSISQYQAHHVDLESTLKPFVPDYDPAIGQTDAFVKVPRPDS